MKIIKQFPENRKKKSWMFEFFFRVGLQKEGLVGFPETRHFFLGGGGLDKGQFDTKLR